MHRRVLGGALKKRYVAKESVGLIVTSPPYNVSIPYSGAASDDTMCPAPMARAPLVNGAL